MTYLKRKRCKTCYLLGVIVWNMALWEEGSVFSEKKDLEINDLTLQGSSYASVMYPPITKKLLILDSLNY